MRKKSLIAFLAVALAILLASPAWAAYYHYTAQVQDQDATPIITGCQVHVYTAGTKTLATIYSNKTGTAKTNPITTTQFATDGKVDFWGTASTYDVAVFTNDGDHFFKSSWGYATSHTFKVDTTRAQKKLVIPFTLNAGTTDTSIEMPVDSLIQDVMVDVTSGWYSYPLATAGVMSVGFQGGTIADLLSSIPVDQTGLRMGATGNAIYYGAGLYGADQSGSRVRVAYKVATGGTPAAISYGTAQTGNTASGYIYILYEVAR